MKFAAHRNSKTLVGHYLDDTSNVDGAATFLGLEPRRDLTEDFRSASMRRNPSLRRSFQQRTSMSSSSAATISIFASRLKISPLGLQLLSRRRCARSLRLSGATSMINGKISLT